MAPQWNVDQGFASHAAWWMVARGAVGVVHRIRASSSYPPRRVYADHAAVPPVSFHTHTGEWGRRDCRWDRTALLADTPCGALWPDRVAHRRLPGEHPDGGQWLRQW